MITDVLRSVLKTQGLTQQEAAQKLGISQGALNLYLSGKRQLKTSFLQHFCDVFQLDIASLFPPAPLPLHTVSVIGFIQAGAFQPSVQWDKTAQYTLDIPQTGKEGLFALEVRGESMNQVYPAGTQVICQKIEAFNEPLTAGKRVICQRTLPDGSVEATVKAYMPQADGVYLMPLSTDKAFVPIKLSADMGQVKILAVVIGSYHPE